MKVLKDSFTESDNKTYDLGRALWAALVVGFIILSLVHYKNFEPWSFASSGSALLVGGAAHLLIKRGTESN